MIKTNCTLVTQKKCNEDQTTIKLNSLDHNTEIVSYIWLGKMQIIYKSCQSNICRKAYQLKVKSGKLASYLDIG